MQNILPLLHRQVLASAPPLFRSLLPELLTAALPVRRCALSRAGP